ncbi:hypothetical protein [Paractinoplanes atraurantiacus]|uniref:Uncharacterized protein n=1 Tax=Paractinoplanes atraurantiacus TaxID=1036182 RepID=A0A285HQP2_9ACTN|nr:hypothetical protein [Actinoplanes atraurantiacus]SNY38080.1 hypothetical protein SAMN05421748_105177 [Actinoplanes atraurantiacus]
MHKDEHRIAGLRRLHELITPEIAWELAEPYGDQIVFPGRVETDTPDDHDRRFPGWPGSVVTISVENQGVCAWGVPMDVAEPPVIVGGGIKTSAGSVRDTTGQCDWWMSNPDPEQLTLDAENLINQFDLDTIVSANSASEDIEQRLRASPHRPIP